MFGKRLLSLAFSVCVLILSVPLAAKDRPLVGIVLYTDASGQSYAQISDFMLNAKREVYVCTGKENLDNSAYHKLEKKALEPGMVLERDTNGLLSLTVNGDQFCALPTNLKLQKQGLSLKEVADLARIDGHVLARSANAAEAAPGGFSPGTAIYVVADAGAEYAEFLRANRAQTIPLWNDYIKQYPTGPHIVEARRAVAELLCARGEAELVLYKKSQADHAPDFGQLKSAKTNADDARHLVSSLTRAEKLQYNITAELQVLLAGARNELNAYLTALNEHKPGYEHLKNSGAQLGNVLAVDPQFTGANKLETDVTGQRQALETALGAGETLLAAKRYDEAFARVTRYKDMAAELPRMAAIITAAFNFHRDRGNEYTGEEQWERAIYEYRQALEYRNEPETAAALKKTQGELDAIEDKAAAERAIDDSKSLAAAKKYIEAYESLDQLSDSRRVLVKDQMDALREYYVKDLVAHATVLRRVHTPIRGHADEDGARQAHDYLERASALTDDQSLRLQLDLLNNAITNYYLAEAKRLLEKPRGSGVGLGWLLLQEAQRFKPEQETVRDQLTKYAPEYENRAKLSISVAFRDQTSLRDSLGFAGQLENAVAAGLESAAIPGLKILTREDRQYGGSESADPAGEADANYVIRGNILQHHVEKKVESANLSSHYRSGQREVKNPAWLEGKRQVDAAQQEYSRAVETQQAAAPRMKKKELAESNKKCEELAAKLREAQTQLDALSETLLQDITSPYNYVKRTTQLNALVEVSFRLEDPLSEVSSKSEIARVEVPKTVVVLENVKPEDSDGIVQEGVPPDETQLLQDAESAVKDSMVKKMIEQLNNVPARILEQARSAASHSDLEEAAAKYILYLNSTPNKDTQERQEAQQFLRSQFSITQTVAAK